MKLVSTLLAAIIALSSVTALGQDDEEESGPPTSADERVGKRYEALAELFGIATPLGTGQGLIGGKFLNPKTVIELSMAFAREEKSDSSHVGRDYTSDFYTYYYEGTSHLISVRYKSFVGNSFYWHGGLADRGTKASMYAIPRIGDEYKFKVATVDAHDIGLTAAIGNAWQWSSFQMGCDWIGFYVPVVRLKKHYDDHDSDVSFQQSLDSERKKFKQQSLESHLQALRFYLGASF